MKKLYVSPATEMTIAQLTSFLCSSAPIQGNVNNVAKQYIEGN